MKSEGGTRRCTPRSTARASHCSGSGGGDASASAMSLRRWTPFMKSQSTAKFPWSAVNSTPIWIQVVRIVCNSEIVPLRRSNPRRPADKGYLQRKPDLKPSSALLDAPTPHLLSHIGCWRARPRLALRDLSHSLRGLRPTATSSRQRTRRGVVLLVVPWLVGAGREARAEAQHARHTDWQRQTCDSRQPTRGAHHHNSSLTLLEHPSASLLSDG